MIAAQISAREALRGKLFRICIVTPSPFSSPSPLTADGEGIARSGGVYSEQALNVNLKIALWNDAQTAPWHASWRGLGAVPCATDSRTAEPWTRDAGSPGRARGAAQDVAG